MGQGAKLPDYTGTGFKFQNATLGQVISTIIPWVFSFAGMALLVMLIFGGITLMTAAGDQNKAKQGYGMISNALIGFVIVFVSYFVVQIVEVVLGVKIF